jgi:hypothetical protein
VFLKPLGWKNLSEEDSLILIEQQSKDIGIAESYIGGIKKEVYNLNG